MKAIPIDLIQSIKPIILRNRLNLTYVICRYVRIFVGCKLVISSAKFKVKVQSYPNKPCVD